MKIVSQIVGLLGVLVALFAVFGRFHGAPTIGLAGHHFAAGSVLLVGNTLLLAGVFLALLEMQTKKPSA